MIIRSTFGLFLILILLIHTLNAINPAYLRQYEQEQALVSFIDSLNKQLNDQRLNNDSSEIDKNDEDIIKRNKYPNFHLSPLWLSRRTRTNRLYGKPLWISQKGK